MPSKKSYYVYWDSCVFLSYLNNYPDRVLVIEKLWDEIADNKDNRIITSSISMAEVAFADYEKTGKALDRSVEAKIDEMWRDRTVLLVDPNTVVMRGARDLMRAAATSGLKMQAADAIHLATAKWVHTNVQPLREFFTYDNKLWRHEALIGMPIKEPQLTTFVQTEFEASSDSTASIETPEDSK